jgi:putative membrane protein
MLRRLTLVVALVAAAVTAIAVPAATAGRDHDDHRGDRGDHRNHGHGKKSVTRHFLVAAAQSNLFEIQSGQLATQKGQSPGVRELGAMLVADHTAELERLTALAERFGIELPTRPNAKQRAQLQALEAAAPGEFDALFLEVQRVAHVKAIALYRLAALKAAKPVRVDAVNALPVLGIHLGVVMQLQGGHVSG